MKTGALRAIGMVVTKSFFARAPSTDSNDTQMAQTDADLLHAHEITGSSAVEPSIISQGPTSRTGQTLIPKGMHKPTRWLCTTMVSRQPPVRFDIGIRLFESDGVTPVPIVWNVPELGWPSWSALA